MRVIVKIMLVMSMVVVMSACSNLNSFVPHQEEQLILEVDPILLEPVDKLKPL